VFVLYVVQSVIVLYTLKTKIHYTSFPVTSPGVLKMQDMKMQHTGSSHVRLTNGHIIRRAKKKGNIQNETRIKACVAHFDAGSYTALQFLRAVSHSLSTRTDALQLRNDSYSSDEDDGGDEQVDTTSSSAAQVSQPSAPIATANLCEVCLVAARDGVALVPCGHARFCTACVDTLVAMSSGCPICRADIHMVMRVYN